MIDLLNLQNIVQCKPIYRLKCLVRFGDLLKYTIQQMKIQLDPKNGDDHLLPMGDHLFEIIKQRYELRSNDPRHYYGQYFPLNF